MSRREYISSTKLDLNSLKVNLMPVKDHSIESQQRIYEVIEIMSQLILLSSKRGRTKKTDGEVLSEAA